MAVYLDWNATAKVRPEAIKAIARTLAEVGNPSSVHAAGRAARAVVETARADIARLVGAAPAAVTFTGCGTEADALAIESAVVAGYERVIVGATEHEAVIETARASALPVEEWPVDRLGVADLGWLAERLAGGPRTLVCLMLANNETGVIQPAAAAAELVRAADGWLHVDAVQAAGKIAIDFNALGADTMALAAHKVGGPQGVGALIAGPRARLTRRLHGGGQERGLRSGTENVAGLAGFAAAARAVDLVAMDAQATWRDALAVQIKAAGGAVLGEGAPRLPQTLCFAAPGFASDLQVIGLDLAGVMVSAGAACSSGKVKASRIAQAMGHDDLAPYVVRVSGGWETAQADWLRCGEAWSQLNERHRARRATAAA
jgi:cysteine desulfurase